jgi:hypothetical protein
VHLRVPEIVAHLWVGLALALQYAENIGAVSAVEAAGVLDEGWMALLEVGEAQTQVVQEEDSARRFLRVLNTLLVQGKAQLLPTYAEPGSRGEEGGRYIEPLGWEDRTHYYLLPDATHAAVVRFCREAGTAFVESDQRVRAELVKRGIAQGSAEGTAITARVGERVRRVLKLRRDAVMRAIGEQAIDDRPEDDAVTPVTAVTGSEI